MDYIILQAKNYRIKKSFLKRLKEIDADIVYGDEKTLNGTFYKPDWSPDLFNDFNYLGGVVAVNKSLYEKGEAGISEEMLYQILKNLVKGIEANRIYHVKEVVAVRKAALAVDTIKPEIETLEVEPLVSIIIPSKDHVELFTKCADSIKNISSYKNYEIILVDNGSNVDNKKKLEEYCGQNNISYLYEKMEFNFSKMCNMGADKAKGELLLFLNDDIEIIQNNWLEILISQAIKKHAGAVGAKLLFPDGDSIQHIGVVNLGVGPSHMLTGKSDSQSYYFGRNRLTYNYLAVTAALLMVDKEKFDSVNGFDEELRVTYNDIDLCFKLYEKGYFNVVRNDVRALHYESASRGQDTIDEQKMQRLVLERQRLWDKHCEFNNGRDPFYNACLAPDYTDFRAKAEQTMMDESRLLGVCNNVNKLDGAFLLNVDPVIYDKDIIVHGWFYWKNDKAMERVKPRLLLIDNSGKAFVFESIITDREDAARINGFGNIRCGFWSRLNLVNINLKEKEYKIGLLLDTGMHRRKAQMSAITLKNLYFTAK